MASQLLLLKYFVHLHAAHNFIQLLEQACTSLYSMALFCTSPGLTGGSRQAQGLPGRDLAMECAGCSMQKSPPAFVSPHLVKNNHTRSDSE